MTADRTVKTNFTFKTYDLTVTTIGTGIGTVTGKGIICPGDCSEIYGYGDSVTLTANPAPGSIFSSWGEDCSGTGSCTFEMTCDRKVTANFTSSGFTLSVGVSGTGSGTVTGTGINCPGDCSEFFNSGTSVTLTAIPATGSDFTGWSGACSGTGTCTVSMTSDLSVSANFTIQNRTLTVNYNGTGGGFVSGPGIACPEDCTEIYNYGNEVTLTAYPSVGSDFTGWSGACSGTGSCVINMLTDSSVTATFNMKILALTVLTAGTGSGIVDGPGINCPGDCSNLSTTALLSPSMPALTRVPISPDGAGLAPARILVQ